MRDTGGGGEGSRPRPDLGAGQGGPGAQCVWPPDPGRGLPRDADSELAPLSGPGRPQPGSGAKRTASPGSRRSLARGPGYTREGSRHSPGTQAGSWGQQQTASPSPWEKSVGGSAAPGGDTALDSRACGVSIQQGHAGHGSAQGLRPQPPSTTVPLPEPEWSGSRPPCPRSAVASHEHHRILTDGSPRTGLAVKSNQRSRRVALSESAKITDCRIGPTKTEDTGFIR